MQSLRYLSSYLSFVLSDHLFIFHYIYLCICLFVLQTVYPFLKLTTVETIRTDLIVRWGRIFFFFFFLFFLFVFFFCLFSPPPSSSSTILQLLFLLLVSPSPLSPQSPPPPSLHSDSCHSHLVTMYRI